MSDPLSIFDAAREAADASALHVGAQRFSFAQLADLTRGRMKSLPPLVAGTPYPLLGTNTLETLVTLYALLARRAPALLLHPKLTEAERGAELDAAGRAGPVAHADAAAILYTSGTTGEPRGVVLVRRSLVASAAASAANLGWQADDCWLLAMPIARVGGLSIVTRCLAARRAVALVSGFDARQWPQLIERHRTTLVSVVPTMLAQVLDAYADWAPPDFLRAILVGGAAASSNLLARAAARRLPIVVTYGCTETCSQVVATPYAQRFATAAHGAGRPLPGVQLRVVDGHIEVKGPMLMAGYLGESALDHDAWLDTGDLGELDADGCLHVRARRGDLIVTGGENVYPAEVERVLQGCPGIKAAGVFGVPDETWGQTVAAALVADGDAPSDAALIEFIGRQLAPHKRPRRICVVALLPHTAAGKPDRLALAAFAPSLRPLHSGD